MNDCTFVAKFVVAVSVVLKVLVKLVNRFVDLSQVVLICLSEILRATLSPWLKSLEQIWSQRFQSGIDKDWLLLESERVVPLVDLTLSKGKNINLSFLVLIAVDHFDEVVLFVFLFIH